MYDGIQSALRKLWHGSHSIIYICNHLGHHQVYRLQHQVAAPMGKFMLYLLPTETIELIQQKFSLWVILKDC